MVAGHLRALDVPAQQDYNDFLFRGSQYQSNFLLDEYGIQRILICSRQAGQKRLPLSERNCSPDKIEHFLITSALLTLL